jgi:hypothetical protein
MFSPILNTLKRQIPILVTVLTAVVVTVVVAVATAVVVVVVVEVVVVVDVVVVVVLVVVDVTGVYVIWKYDATQAKLKSLELIPKNEAKLAYLVQSEPLSIISAKGGIMPGGATPPK